MNDDKMTHTNVSRVKKITVSGLFGELSYSIELNTEERITIAYGPNGIGKTTLLRMIDTLFKGNFFYLARTPFDSLAIDFVNGSNMAIENFNRENKRKLKISYSNSNDGEFQPFEIDVDVLLKSGERGASTYIERYVPGLIQVAPETWLDRRTERQMTFDEVIEEYGAFLPSKVMSKSIKAPDWFKNLITQTSVKLIETQRLFYLTGGSRSRHLTSGSETRNAVASFAEDLTNIISDTLSKYAEMSQSLDSTFPTRLVNQSGYTLLAGDDIVKSLNDLQMKRNVIMNFGILPKEGGAIAFSESSRIDGSENVLSLYIKDVSQKLGLFDDIIKKMSILSEIVNSKFARKTLSFSVKKGFVFKLNDGSELAYSKLSSGEQHEIVMLYELLFKTAPKSLIMIDEPEISLHVVWQQRYLTDLAQITDLQPMDVLIMTHSPQIIHNSWDLTFDIGEHLENA